MSLGRRVKKLFIMATEGCVICKSGGPGPLRGSCTSGSGKKEKKKKEKKPQGMHKKIQTTKKKAVLFNTRFRNNSESKVRCMLANNLGVSIWNDQSRLSRLHVMTKSVQWRKTLFWAFWKESTSKKWPFHSTNFHSCGALSNYMPKYLATKKSSKTLISTGIYGACISPFIALMH